MKESKQEMPIRNKKTMITITLIRKKFSMMIICLDMKHHQERKNNQMKKTKKTIPITKIPIAMKINQPIRMRNHHKKKNPKPKCYTDQRIWKN